MLRGTWHEVISESWTDELKSEDIYDLFSILVPAIFNSGLAQIASFTDLCFASHFAGAAAGLSYAFLLVMAPLGLLSSIVILPLLPIFSGLIKIVLADRVMANPSREDKQRGPALRGGSLADYFCHE